MVRKKWTAIDSQISKVELFVPKPFVVKLLAFPASFCLMLRSFHSLFLISPALVVVASVTSWGVGSELMWYRVTTSFRALKAVYTLPEKHVTDFLESYKLFDQEHVTGKNKEAENTVKYYQVLNHLCAVGEVT